MPNAKVSAGGVVGAVSVLIVAALAAFGITLEPAVASAITALLGFGAAYLKREGIDLDQSDV